MRLDLSLMIHSSFSSHPVLTSPSPELFEPALPVLSKPVKEKTFSSLPRVPPEEALRSWTLIFLETLCCEMRTRLTLHITDS